MEIKQFIEKAEKGGYKKSDRENHLRTKFNISSIPYEVVLLDPLAWKAVGKVEGWGYKTKGNWFDKMHQMIDALCEGKSIEEYIKTL